ncbi:F-box/kelch-repeat protein At3g24760-like [Ananas comosus]|uniref:F-box/kelch-repeat protein At3g24760-like n=1 Tax=Ananas comosus TaxID=4615 RepID=A0A6P5H7T9_ANACO|nr:F-box/kelch-repeat protein At3g24760-like [Ananas comosus]
MAAGDSPNNKSGQTDGGEAPPAAAAACSAVPAAEWERLGWDLTELILCRLPLRSLVRAGAVCRQWRAVVARCPPSTWSSSRRRLPWLFVFAHHNLVPRLSSAFAYDPSDDESAWIPLPAPSAPLPDSFSGSGGFSFSFLSSSPSRLSLSPLLRPQTTFLSPPLAFPRSNPLVVSVLSSGHERPSVVVVGGARVVGGLVDIEDRLPVEIYEAGDDAWELGPPLPAEFRPGCSSQWLSAALLPGRGLLFVLATYSGVLSAFDLARGAWTRPRPLRPRAPGPPPLFAFLAAARGRLVLAGLRSGPDYGPAQFAVWAVDDAAMECEEVGAMPAELLAWLFDGEGAAAAAADDDDDRFASLKCAGVDGVVYVFNEDRHRGFPACVCEISEDDDAPGGLRCAWRKVPPLPAPVDPFHKVIAFCSPVPVHPVLAPRGPVVR